MSRARTSSGKNAPVAKVTKLSREQKLRTQKYWFKKRPKKKSGSGLQKGSPHVDTIEVVITGQKVVTVGRLRKGSVLERLQNYTEEEIRSLVGSKRTLARRMVRGGLLTAEERDKAVRLAKIAKLAADVFGDNSKAHRWLRKPKVSLGGETPLAYLATEAGTDVIEDMLNQIDHGILP